jgi:hypothetical protein
LGRERGHASEIYRTFLTTSESMTLAAEKITLG